MSRIFISHSSADGYEAAALKHWLAQQGWDDVFLDADSERGISPGEAWERALVEAASRCEAVVFLISPNWLASGWCRREYELARSLHKKLFAVLIASALADIPAELRSVWQVGDLTSRHDARLFPTRLAGGSEERPVAFSDSGLARLRRGLEKAGLDPRFFVWPPAGDPGRAPYRGLKPLESEDAGVFFGRAAAIVEATDRLRGLAAAGPPRLFALLGASGAGKSSFLRAGLLPRLARDDAHFVVLAPIRPEQAALTGETGLIAALAAALPGRNPDEWRATARGGAAALRPWLARLVAAALARRLAGDEAERPPCVLLAVDQAEELFRSQAGEESEALLALIAGLVAADDPRVIVVFAIRSDSYDALERAKALGGLRQTAFPLLPMPRAAYAEVIGGPARRSEEAGRKLAIEPRLTERLLADVEADGGSDALPLLAFTLEQLYLDHGSAGALRLADYEASDGLKGVINAAVQRVLRRADDDPRLPPDREARLKLLRRGLIPWLAGVDPETRSPRRAIARRSDVPAETAPLMDLMVEERLLSTGARSERDAAGAPMRVPTLEPTHEALLRRWGLLEGWLKEDFGLLAAQEAVQRAARDWDANARDPAWLAHRGQRLADADALDAGPDLAAKFDASDRAYLAACREREAEEAASAEQRRREREEERGRRLRDAEALAASARSRLRAITAGFVVAVALLALAAWFAYRVAGEKAIATRNESVGLTAISNSLSKSRRYADAVMLAVAAWPRAGDESRPQLRETADALAAALPSMLERGRLNVRPGARAVDAAQFLGTSASLVVLPSAGAAQIWDAAEWCLRRRLGADADRFWTLAVSSDGLWIGTGMADGSLRVYEAETGALVAAVAAHGHSVDQVAFSPDARQIASSSLDEPDVRIWTRTLQPAGRLPTLGKVQGFQYSPDGSRLAVRTDADIVQLLAARDGRVEATVGPFDGRLPTSAAFLGTGDRLVTTWLTGATVVSVAATGAAAATLADCAKADTRAYVARDRRRLFLACGDGVGVVYDALTLKKLATIKGPSVAAEAVFSADGEWLATAAWNGSAEVWNASDGERAAELTGHADGVLAVDFGPADQVVTASADGTVRLWSPLQFARHRRLAPTDGEARFADAARQGDALLVVAKEGLTAVPLNGDPPHVLISDFDTFVAGGFSRDGALVAALGYSGDVFVLTYPGDVVVARIKGPATSLAFSPAADLLAVGGADGTVRLADPRTGEEARSLGTAAGGKIVALAFSDDGAALLAATPRAARVFDLAAGAPGLDYRPPADTEIVGVAIAPDGAAFATVGAVGQPVRILDARTGAVKATFDDAAQFAESAAFSPDGGRVVTAATAYAAVWDVATGSAVARFGPGDSELAWAGFSPDGTSIVALAKAGEVRIWDAGRLEAGDAFAVACQRLKFGASLDEAAATSGLFGLTPICQPDHEPLAPKFAATPDRP